jgi:hypothetical protein
MLEVVKHDLVSTARGDHLPIAPAQGAIGPPAVFHKPGLAHGVNGPAVDDQRAAILTGANRDAPRRG